MTARRTRRLPALLAAVGIVAVVGCTASPDDSTPAAVLEPSSPTTPEPPPEGMVRVPAGAVPRSGGELEVPTFDLDVYEVTNRDFAAFVDATGFVTEAERWGWSMVFHPEATANPAQEQRVPGTPWWLRVDGADWRRPRGPGAEANPTSRSSTSVGATPKPSAPGVANGCRPRPNGISPRRPATTAPATPATPGATSPTPTANGSETSGRATTSRIGTRRPTGTPTWRRSAPIPRTRSVSSTSAETSGSGATTGIGPEAPAARRVLKGGSWLCAASYCEGYRNANRNHSAPDSGLDNTGFRCARSLR